MIDHEYILFRGTSWNSKTIKIDSDEKWYSYVVFKYFFAFFRMIFLYAHSKNNELDSILQVIDVLIYSIEYRWIMSIYLFIMQNPVFFDQIVTTNILMISFLTQVTRRS